ncbi:MAG TPA: phosphatase PAP2 family protein [Pyrinomonadaceae bacterium]|jgi:membrane-associated phospholipid phosphatase|nr:phosphatase PAP2 family protein [Pyrinomonadaceae bacterium]
MRRQKNSMRAFVMIVFAIFLATAGGVRAQIPTATPSPSPKSLEKEFFRNILRDQKAIWTAPFHLHRADAKWMIPSGIGAMALFTTDRITGDQIADSQRQVKASQIVSYAGSVYGLGAVATTFYLVGRKKSDDRARETGILSAEALADSLIVSGALKEIAQRARPLEGRERSEFFDGGNSFPSGHSVQVWSVAAVIANEYHDRQLIKLAAYGIASAVSVARFTERKHYISDVVVGSAAGYAIGRYVYKAHHRDPSITQSRWPAIVPHYSRSARQYGVGLTWSF